LEVNNLINSLSPHHFFFTFCFSESTLYQLSCPLLRPGKLTWEQSKVYSRFVAHYLAGALNRPDAIWSRNTDGPWGVSSGPGVNIGLGIKSFAMRTSIIPLPILA
jgi:hypothetical protein